MWGSAAKNRGQSPIFLLLWCGSIAAQDIPPPQFPRPAPLEPRSAPASARQHAEMASIAAGLYRIGPPDAEHAVALRRFRIDRTEVTNAQFAEFLNALPVKPLGTARGGKAAPANFAVGDRRLFLESFAYPVIGLDDDEARIGVRDGRFVADSGFESHPVTEVTWAGALAYCRWRGARLPSEADWEAAARGPAGRRYPWGDAAPSGERAAVGQPSGATLPVGSRPKGATPEGLLDMAGSLAEWTSTLYRPYPYRAADGRENPAHPGERVTRGGDYVFQSAPEHLVTWHRAGFSRRPSSGHRHIGLRCAAD
jgi:formylglycine-generating enzyme required for sulfatase activity